MKCIEPEYSIYANNYYGPKFGRGDLDISTNSNTRNESYSRLGTSYESKGTSELADSNYFLTTEIEVYKKE